jgi:hypothetical protein
MRDLTPVKQAVSETFSHLFSHVRICEVRIREDTDFDGEDILRIDVIYDGTVKDLDGKAGRIYRAFAAEAGANTRARVAATFLHFEGGFLPQQGCFRLICWIPRMTRSTYAAADQDKAICGVPSARLLCNVSRAGALLRRSVDRWIGLEAQQTRVESGLQGS